MLNNREIVASSEVLLRKLGDRYTKLSSREGSFRRPTLAAISLGPAARRSCSRRSRLICHRHKGRVLHGLQRVPARQLRRQVSAARAGQRAGGTGIAAGTLPLPKHTRARHSHGLCRSLEVSDRSGAAPGRRGGSTPAPTAKALKVESSQGSRAPQLCVHRRRRGLDLLPHKADTLREAVPALRETGGQARGCTGLVERSLPSSPPPPSRASASRRARAST